jgi:hypothetical protein
VIFLQLLDAYAKEGRHVGSAASSLYAPKIFSEDKRSFGIGKGALKDAMNSLFAKGKIENAPEPGLPASRQRKRIVRKGTA